MQNEAKQLKKGTNKLKKGNVEEDSKEGKWEPYEVMNEVRVKRDD